MKKLMTASVIASALMAPVLVHAATTADLKLIGTIVPTSCTPNFVGGSTIDYGNIAASALNSTAVTALPDKTTSLTITCSAPVKFALGVTDERAASLVAAAGKFGLGVATNNAKIGGYNIYLSNAIPDTGTTGILYSSNSGSSWGASAGDMGPILLMAFNAGGTSIVPAPHQSITADVKFKAVIDKSANLPITSQINIDGLATIEVKYL